MLPDITYIFNIPLCRYRLIQIERYSVWDPEGAEWKPKVKMWQEWSATKIKYGEGGPPPKKKMKYGGRSPGKNIHGRGGGVQEKNGEVKHINDGMGVSIKKIYGREFLEKKNWDGFSNFPTPSGSKIEQS